MLELLAFGALLVVAAVALCLLMAALFVVKLIFAVLLWPFRLLGWLLGWLLAVPVLVVVGLAVVPAVLLALGLVAFGLLAVMLVLLAPVLLVGAVIWLVARSGSGAVPVLP